MHKIGVIKTQARHVNYVCVLQHRRTLLARPPRRYSETDITQ